MILFFDLVYPQLVSLTIGDCQLPLRDLEFLLSLTPSLICLKLVSSRSVFDSIFDGSYWEHFIQNKLLLLKKFEFFFTCNVNESNGITHFDSLILPFQTSFWLNNKHWLVTCDCTPRELKTRLYTTPVCKIDVKTKSPIFEVSSTNSNCRLVLHSDEEVSLNMDTSLRVYQFYRLYSKNDHSFLSLVLL